ncbi:MAG: hypothetical protein OHK0012_12780 [Synechococcales cyanobacterium]
MPFFSVTSRRLIVFGLHPASPMERLSLFAILALLFVGSLIWRWVHGSGLVLVFSGVALLILAKLDICIFDREQRGLSWGTGLWWQRHQASLEALQRVYVDTLMLEDVDELERDVIYRVMLDVDARDPVPVCRHWGEDRQEQDAICEKIQRFLDHA